VGGVNDGCGCVVECAWVNFGDRIAGDEPLCPKEQGWREGVAANAFCPAQNLISEAVVCVVAVGEDRIEAKGDDSERGGVDCFVMAHDEEAMSVSVQRKSLQCIDAIFGSCGLEVDVGTGYVIFGGKWQGGKGCGKRGGARG